MEKLSLGQGKVVPSDSSQSAELAAGFTMFFLIYCKLNYFLGKISRRLLTIFFQYKV